MHCVSWWPPPTPYPPPPPFLQQVHGLSWELVASVQTQDPLSSEGISMLSLPGYRCLLTFGGYNGKYTNAVSVFGVKVGRVGGGVGGGRV